MTLRLGVLAVAVCLIAIGFQMNQVGKPAPRDASTGASAMTATAALASLPSPAAGLLESNTATGSAAPLDELSPRLRDPQLVRFHGLLDGVADFEDVAQNRAYAALGDHVRRLTDEEAARIVRRDLDFQRIVKEPAAVRGEVVVVDGLLIKLEPVRLVPGAGPEGVEDAWRGWIIDPSGDECYVFDLIGAPVEISRREMVRVEGAFLKVIRYENQRGQPRDAAFLMARRVWRPSADEIERPVQYHYYAVVLIAVIGVGLVIARKRAADDEARLEIKRREHERLATKPKPPRNA